MMSEMKLPRQQEGSQRRLIEAKWTPGPGLKHEWQANPSPSLSLAFSM